MSVQTGIIWVRLARRERHCLTDICRLIRRNRQPIRNKTELPRRLVARNRTRAALFPNAAVFLAHRVEKQISNHSLHPGALRCMVNRRICVVVGAVIACVHRVAQLVIHADLIAVIVEVIAKRLARNFISNQRHVIAVGVRDVRRSQRRAVLHARYGRVRPTNVSTDLQTYYHAPNLPMPQPAIQYLAWDNLPV